MATLYPYMVQLRTEALGRQLKLWKKIIISLIYVFILFPLLAISVASKLGPQFGIGFVAANSVPASSAALGYVLISAGNVELATALILI
ncbi:hypothetical protein [Fervidicoccus sp.]|uniref:hypothetical protein n=1 Tax=Fervidicoccus sp. TaxID=2060324 RepID=UPI003D0DB4C6